MISLHPKRNTKHKKTKVKFDDRKLKSVSVCMHGCVCLIILWGRFKYCALVDSRGVHIAWLAWMATHCGGGRSGGSERGQGWGGEELEMGNGRVRSLELVHLAVGR